MKSHALVLWSHSFFVMALFAQSQQKESSIVQGILLDDFLVNDDTAGGASQGDPAIAMNGSGNFVMVWEDERNGNLDIYFQRYDASGVRLGNNQKVNDDGGIVRQWFPSIAIDSRGNFVIAWVDYREGTNSYFQRYDSSGVRQGNNQQANEETGRVSSADRFSSIAMDDSGNFVIAWVDDRNTVYHDIYFQRYNASGVKQGDNQKANDDAGNTWQGSPAIAMRADSGNFVMAWKSGTDIYFQRFNSSGLRQGNNQKTNEVARQAWVNPLSISMNNSGNFVIAWTNHDNGDFDIYFQRYDLSGAMLGNNQRVNNDAESPRQYNPSVAMDDNGNIAIAWQGEKIGQRYRYDLYLQRYDTIGGSRGNNQRVNDDAESAWIGFQSIAMAGSGNFAIVWADDRHGNSDIYFQRYDLLGVRQGNNRPALDDTASARQRFPAIAMEASGNFVIAWVDGRNDDNYDIYFQRYDSSGGRRGSNQSVNEEAESGGQRPSIAVDGNGNFVIVWGDSRNSSTNTDIYFQRYDSFGDRRGNNQKVNDDSPLGGQAPTIAMDRGGNFVIAWDDLRDENNDIYLQRYDASGVKQGNNQKVNDDEGKSPQNNPTIAMHSTGNFVMAWSDSREGNSDIYFQRYDSSGSRQGNNQKVNDAAGGVRQYPAMAMDGSGNFMMVWDDSRNGNLDIYFQRYDFSGAGQGNNQRVNDDAGSARQSYPAIAREESGNFVIVWQDYRYDALLPDIMGQRYYPDGARRGGNYRIVADGPLKLEEYPVVTANSQRMVFAWMDYRRPAKSSDIFAKIVTWDWEGVTAVADQRLEPEYFGLFQNYPNPFNPATTIAFSLPKACFVTLKIHDLLGKEVATLVAEKLPAGKHLRMWEANGLVSGVYFYRLDVSDPSTSLSRAESRGSGRGFVQTKKLILLR